VAYLSYSHNQTEIFGIYDLGLCINIDLKGFNVMPFEVKSNLSQIFRQSESRTNLAQIDLNKESLVRKPLSLRVTRTSFVVDNKFALQLDEVI
jgi:hypothetical protein